MSKNSKLMLVVEELRQMRQKFNTTKRNNLSLQNPFARLMRCVSNIGNFIANKLGGRHSTKSSTISRRPTARSIITSPSNRSVWRGLRSNTLLDMPESHRIFSMKNGTSGFFGMNANRDPAAAILSKLHRGRVTACVRAFSNRPAIFFDICGSSPWRFFCSPGSLDKS